MGSFISEVHTVHGYSKECTTMLMRPQSLILKVTFIKYFYDINV